MTDPTDRASGAEGEPRRLAGALDAIDHATTWIERPVRRIAGSNRLNPLPHAGTISVFLLGVVIVTGLYITLFFEFGHAASYDAVTKMEGHAIQKVVRALHRYASAAMVLTTLVHAWRIFAGGRYTGRLRRWRWATGVASLLLVWLAGVTGYWLIWDVRAQAISEATANILAPLGVGTGFLVHSVLETGDAGIGGSGSGFLLFLWFAHVILTIVIGWFIFRHLRRSRLPWLPPRHWMLLMGGALLLVSLALPVGMLARADATRMTVDMPLDPFVLFLLPPLLSSWALVAIAVLIVVAAVAFLFPKLLTRHDPPSVEVDDEACTGCDLCAVDCPYDAITMVDRPLGSDGEAPRHPTLAVIADDRCVSCGICIGSCMFGALSFPGQDPIAAFDPAEVAGHDVVVACDRHQHATRSGGPTSEGTSVVLSVGCAGTVGPSLIRELTGAGATGVQLIGCAPNDCRFGIGNTLAAERVLGERAPHPPRKAAALISQDWVSSDDVQRALSEPGQHPDADGRRLPGGREVLVGAGAIVAFSAIGVGFATRAPFHPASEQAQVRIVVDHTPGNALDPDSSALLEDPTVVGAITTLEVRIDGEAIETIEVGDDPQQIHLYDADVPADTAMELEVVASDAVGSVTLLDDTVTLAAGRRLLVAVVDDPPEPGAVEGRDLFESRQAGCTTCHSVEEGDDGVGPSLYGVGTRSADRVEGFNAALYLRNSILLPDQYIVEGYPAGQMLPIYRDRFDDDEIDALVAYLLTLTDEAG